MNRLPLAGDSPLTADPRRSALALAAVRRRRAKPLITFPSPTLPFAYLLFTQPYPAARESRAFLTIESVEASAPERPR